MQRLAEFDRLCFAETRGEPEGHSGVEGYWYVDPDRFIWESDGAKWTRGRRLSQQVRVTRG